MSLRIAGGAGLRLRETTPLWPGRYTALDSCRIDLHVDGGIAAVAGPVVAREHLDGRHSLRRAHRTAGDNPVPPGGRQGARVRGSEWSADVPGCRLPEEGADSGPHTNP